MDKVIKSGQHGHGTIQHHQHQAGANGGLAALPAWVDTSIEVFDHEFN